MRGVYASVFRTTDWRRVVMKLADNCLVELRHLSYRLEWLLHILTWKDKHWFGPQGADELFMTTNEAKILLPNERVAPDYCRIYYELDLSKESCDRVCSKIFASFAITNNNSAPCVWTDMFIISHARVADTMWFASFKMRMGQEYNPNALFRGVNNISDSISDGVTGSKKKKELG